MNLQSDSHSRQNLLTGEWVMVSPHRTERPWHGQVEHPDSLTEPVFDSECYLCPGNERAGGQRNPQYSGPWAFDNDFPALSGHSAVENSDGSMFVTRPEQGCCRVICFSERHDLRLASMNQSEVLSALKFVIDEFVELDGRDDISYVQVFENRGKMMGSSNGHPHAQIWATGEIPNEPAKELQSQADYYGINGSSLLLDYLAAEQKAGSRIVCASEHIVSLVPFWAVWPYETMLIPGRAVAAPNELSDEELADFANVLRSTLAACERLFQASVPYSMGFHPRPSDGKQHPEWQFHAHIYPPLLRSATVRKHLVGFEMLGMPQRDLTPEVAARRLRDHL